MTRFIVKRYFIVTTAIKNALKLIELRTFLLIINFFIILGTEIDNNGYQNGNDKISALIFIDFLIHFHIVMPVIFYFNAKMSNHKFLSSPQSTVIESIVHRQNMIMVCT